MTKSNRKALLTSIANTIADYRQGDIPTPDADHVDTWIKQFDASVQEPILVELDHVLRKTYITRASVEQFLAGVLTAKDLVRDDPCGFWRKANFLDIQRGGSSQREMLAMFNALLQKTCGLSLDACGSDDGPRIYLDDVIFTGNRIRTDVSGWIESSVPGTSKVHVVVIGLHRGGQWYAGSEIEKAAGKTLDITWWRCLEIEDRKKYVADSDVLRPSFIPNDVAVQAYAQALQYQPVLRTGNRVGANSFFSSDAGRNLLEQEFLKAGVHIRSICQNLNEYQRPLGNMVLQALGFGALIVTFRNCANNCPLAFWVDDPWYPLFPRKTN